MAETVGALQTILEEYEASLGEVCALLVTDPDNTDLAEMQADLQEAKAQTESDLAELISTTEGHAKVEEVALEFDSTLPTNGPQIGPAIGPQMPSSLQTVQVPTDEDSVAGSSVRKSRIHLRNLYAAEEPDFARLASQDEQLRSYVTVGANNRGSIDFKDPEACRQLTRALLKHDYGIDWWVDDGQLVPAVTNRANYIHWLQDLLQLSCPPGPVRGLDVGCGANLIYCLLGATICGWQFVGIDVTRAAAQGAQRNIYANPELAGLLEVRIAERESTGPEHIDLKRGILTPAVRDGERFAFSMCNPPFFESMEEAGQNPATAFGGTSAEMVCPGGELAFVQQMVQDSLSLRERVHWYTSMVGKKASMKVLRQSLQGQGVTALRTTEFAQGRTSRWGIAWSFAREAASTAAAPLQRHDMSRVQLPTKRQTVISIKGPTNLAAKILQACEAVLSSQGATCVVDQASFSLTARIEISAQDDSDAENAEEASNAPAAKRQRSDAEGSNLGIGRQYELRLVVLSDGPGSFAVKVNVPHNSSEVVARHFTGMMQLVESDVRQLLAS